MLADLIINATAIMDQLHHYFAYGSNMSRARLQARVPAAGALGVSELRDWRLSFDKHGRDQHAKANIRSSGGDCVWGVLYRLHRDHRAPLDRAEGLGVEYGLRRVAVRHPHLGQLDAYTYTALRLHPGLPMQDWYLGHLLTGIEEHGLPQHWQQHILMLAAAQPETAT